MRLAKVPTPDLPEMDLSLAFNNVGTAPVSLSLTADLDKFMATRTHLEPHERILQYLQSLTQSVDNSLLLYAQLADLYFQGDNKTLLFAIDQGVWFTWSERGWNNVDGTNQVMERFQTGFLTVVRQVRDEANVRNTFPRDVEKDEPHPRMTGIMKLVSLLESKTLVKPLIEQSAIFFRQHAVFDTDSLIFQCQNCVLDLSVNAFRRTRPTDMTSRASRVHIPDAWLNNKDLIMPQSAPQRAMAWKIVWSIFKRGKSDFHPGDFYEELGDCDVDNFQYFITLVCRLLEGRPIQKVIMPFSERGRNSKGLVEKGLESVFGTYLAPAKNTIFNEDRRTEDEHNAGALDRQGIRIVATSEPPEQPWSNATFKNKVSRDKVSARGCGSKVIEKFAPTCFFCTALITHLAFNTKLRDLRRIACCLCDVQTNSLILVHLRHHHGNSRRIPSQLTRQNAFSNFRF